MSTEIIPSQKGELATTTINLGGIVAAIMSGELTAEKLAMMERLTKMDAEQQFNRAFSEMQAEIPEFVADAEIPKRGKYLRFETMMHTLKPIYTRHDFSVAYSQVTEEKRVTVKCTVRHKAGHFSETSYTVRVGSGDTELQADCKASTTAKRYATALAFALVIHQQTINEDTDAGLEGGKITAEQAAELQRRFDAVCPKDSRREAWTRRMMALAHATTFAEMLTSKLPVIEEAIAAAESAKPKSDMSLAKEDLF